MTKQTRIANAGNFEDRFCVCQMNAQAGNDERHLKFETCSMDEESYRVPCHLSFFTLSAQMTP